MGEAISPLPLTMTQLDVVLLWGSSEPVDYEDFDGDETTIDLRAHHVLGGVLHFDLLQMPPQPKIVKGWTITQRMSHANITDRITSDVDCI